LATDVDRDYAEAARRHVRHAPQFRARAEGGDGVPRKC
jgi:hypothetical protein